MENSRENDAKRRVSSNEEFDIMKTSLLANISHEFRTPMNGILGFADILRKEVADPVFAEMAEHIYKSGKRLLSTLNSILEYSELSGSKSDVHPDQFSLSELTSDIAQEWRKTAEESGLMLKQVIRGNILMNTDRNLLKQGINKIMDNALKFTHSGSVTIEVSGEQLDGTLLGVIRITDTGIGIPESHKEFIFNEFRQSSEGYSRNYEGSGLGLAIAQKVVDLLDGTIEVESKIHEGSSFTIKLPGARIFDTVINITPSGINLKEIGDVKSARSCCGPLPDILFVEDNILNVKVTELHLKGLFNLDHARDGAAALEMAGSKSYSAVLMDINLGKGLNGIEVMQKIREIEGYEEKPIIAVTGYAMPGDKKKLLDMGFSHYLAKPYDKSEIVGLLMRTVKI
ncbi:MAG: hybrid sensor histidine kinase/response regulator [Ignavibacteriales bacterium]